MREQETFFPNLPAGTLQIEVNMLQPISKMIMQINFRMGI